MPVESVPDYALACAINAQAAAQTRAMTALASASMTMNANAPASDAFVFTSLTVTGGVADVNIHLPAGPGFRVDLFCISRLTGFPWSLLTTTPTNTDTVHIQVPCSFSNAFFRAGNADIDTDGDGIPDDREILMYGTNPNAWSTLTNGIPDGWAIAHCFNPLDPNFASQDTDGDGLSNLQEYQFGSDPRNPDTDGDGMSDGAEVLYWGNPTAGLSDYDDDQDGIPNGWAVAHGLNPVAGTGVANRNRLVAWWYNCVDPFEDTWLLDRMNNQTGVPNNVPSETISAYPPIDCAYAIKLTSNASIMMYGDKTELSPRTNFSIATWHRPYGSYSSGYIISKNNAYALNGYTGYIYSNNRSYTFTIYTNATGSVSLTAFTNLLTNTWAHVAAVYDYSHSNLALYINGTLATSRTCRAFVNTNDADVFIGCNPRSGSAYNCFLGDTRFYDSALSATEIAAMNQFNQLTPWGETMVQACQNGHPVTSNEATSVSVAITNWGGTLTTWCSNSHQEDNRAVTFVLAPDRFTGSFVLKDSNGFIGYQNASQSGGMRTVPWLGTSCDTTLTAIWTFAPTLAFTNSVTAHFDIVPRQIAISGDSPNIRNASDNAPVQYNISGPTNDSFTWKLAPASLANGASIASQGTNGTTATILPGHVVTNYTVTGKCAYHDYSDSSDSSQLQVVAPTVSIVQRQFVVATNAANSNLTFSVVNNFPYSATNLTWSITPSGVSGGATFIGPTTGPTFTIHPGSVATSYVIKAETAHYYDPSSTNSITSCATSMLYVIRTLLSG